MNRNIPIPVDKPGFVHYDGHEFTVLKIERKARRPCKY